MSGDSLMQIIIHVMLFMAVYSYLEYCIRAAQQPELVNRRAKIACGIGLAMAVTGMWTTLVDPQIGVALTVVGNFTAVGAMLWLEAKTPGRRSTGQRTSGAKMAAEGDIVPGSDRNSETVPRRQQPVDVDPTTVDLLENDPAAVELSQEESVEEVSISGEAIDGEAIGGEEIAGDSISGEPIVERPARGRTRGKRSSGQSAAPQEPAP